MFINFLLVFSPMPISLTLDNNNKVFTSWTSTGIPPEKKCRLEIKFKKLYFRANKFLLHCIVISN